MNEITRERLCALLAGLDAYCSLAGSAAESRLHTSHMETERAAFKATASAELARRYTELANSTHVEIIAYVESLLRSDTKMNEITRQRLGVMLGQLGAYCTLAGRADENRRHTSHMEAESAAFRATARRYTELANSTHDEILAYVECLLGSDDHVV